MTKVIGDSTATLPTTEERVRDDPVFGAPGDGTWELESTHFQRPITRFAAAASMAGFRRGFAESTARYGLLLDHLRLAIVNGFVYIRPTMFGADGSATEAEMQARLATSVHAFQEKLWRQDLDQWDRVDKPAAIVKHLAIQDVDPAALSGDELARHLGRCRDHLEAMMYLHHKYTATAIVSVGDFLAGAQEWTRVAAGELL
ncbi:MAG: hypothetical protein M3143_11000, partial [Actinomycetota bacterium]|nr:hypothetical protein [Actinomycetota bacterium]